MLYLNKFNHLNFTFLPFQTIIWNQKIGSGASGVAYLCQYNSIQCISKCFYLQDYHNIDGLINDVSWELSIYQYLKDVNCVSEIIGFSYDEKEEYFCILMKYYSSINLDDYIHHIESIGKAGKKDIFKNDSKDKYKSSTYITTFIN